MKGLPARGESLVDEIGHHVLAGAGLAGDEHGHAARGGAGGRLHHAGHLLGGVDELAAALDVPQALDALGLLDAGLVGDQHRAEHLADAGEELALRLGEGRLRPLAVQVQEPRRLARGPRGEGRDQDGMDVLLLDALQAHLAGGIGGRGPDQGLAVLERRLHGGMGIAFVVLRQGAEQGQPGLLEGEQVAAVRVHELHAQGQDVLGRLAAVGVLQEADDALQQPLVGVGSGTGRDGRRGLRNLRFGGGLGREFHAEDVLARLDLVALGEHVLAHQEAVHLHLAVHGDEAMLPGAFQDLEVDLADVLAGEDEVVHGAAAGREDVMGHVVAVAGAFVPEDHGLPALSEGGCPAFRNTFAAASIDCPFDAKS